MIGIGMPSSHKRMPRPIVRSSLLGWPQLANRPNGGAAKKGFGSDAGALPVSRLSRDGVHAPAGRSHDRSPDRLHRGARRKRILEIDLTQGQQPVVLMPVVGAAFLLPDFAGPSADARVTFVASMIQGSLLIERRHEEATAGNGDGSEKVGSRQQAAGSRQQAAGSRQQAAGSRQQEMDRKRRLAVKPSMAAEKACRRQPRPDCLLPTAYCLLPIHAVQFGSSGLSTRHPTP